VKPERTRRRFLPLAAALLACGLVAAFAYRAQVQLLVRISELRASIKYALQPPGEAVFTPDPSLAAMVSSTLAALQSPTPSPRPTEAASPRPSTPAGTPTPTPTPLPEQVLLRGIRHEYQQWNNCGPATLGMALSYWGWQGDQRPIASFTKPNPRDKNVMPYELADFVETQTDLRVLSRVGGDLDLLKRLIAAGFPVMIEKGLEVAGVEGWMGHYEVLAGYDDGKQVFNAYDSYEGDFSGGRTLPVSYQTVQTYWRHFNYTYLVIYPPEREAEVLAILGTSGDETTNTQLAAQLASDEIFATSDRDLFFAWYNRGTNLMRLQDYAGAAAAYDEAFQLYAALDPEVRPWRVLWYQTGPYFAYYYTGRYWDVINLATQTLDNMSEPVLEESYYWRGLAREALGDVSGAIADYRTSVEMHAGFEPALAQLDRLGIAP
jgi:hypothetical protein